MIIGLLWIIVGISVLVSIFRVLGDLKNLYPSLNIAIHVAINSLVIAVLFAFDDISIIEYPLIILLSFLAGAHVVWAFLYNKFYNK